MGCPKLPDRSQPLGRSSPYCEDISRRHCWSEMCGTRLAGNTGRKSDAKNHHLGTIPQFCRAIPSQIRHVSTTGKNLLDSNISPTCPHNMVNSAEIGSVVWGTQANFNGFRVLASLLHGVEQRAPAIFGRAAITLGIGPYSSYFCSE